MNRHQIEHLLNFHGFRNWLDAADEIRIEIPEHVDPTPPEEAEALRAAMESERCVDTSTNELEQVVRVMLNDGHSDEAKAAAEQHFTSLLARPQAAFEATLNDARQLLAKIENRAAQPAQAQTPTERFHAALNKLRCDKPWTANHQKAAAYLAIARLSEQRDFDAVAAGMETI